MDASACAVCGYRAAADETLLACSHCPLARRCDLCRCPRCGYEWPPESRLARWISRAWRRLQKGFRHDRAS